jgi:hypothetical protein
MRESPARLKRLFENNISETKKFRDNVFRIRNGLPIFDDIGLRITEIFSELVSQSSAVPRY